MRTPAHLLGAAGLVASAIVCLPAFAETQASPPPLIKLLSLTTSASRHAMPPAPPGLPAGSTPTSSVLEVDRLYNGVRQFGHARLALVGSDRTILMHFRSGREWVSVNTKLPGGTIYVRGYARSATGILTVAVTGGTGRYAGARGTLAIFDLPKYVGLAANVYRLQR